MATIETENIPIELRELKQWVCWQLHKKTKVPKIAWNKFNNASTTKSKDWASYDMAIEYVNQGNHTGVGFVFTKDDPYCGIDLDNCRDPQTGDIKSWAREILDKLESYSEVSQSGCGIHVIVKAQLPGNGGFCITPPKGTLHVSHNQDRDE